MKKSTNEKMYNGYLQVAEWLKSAMLVSEHFYDELTKIQFEYSHKVLYDVCNIKMLYDMQINYITCIEYLHSVKYTSCIDNLIDFDDLKIDLKALSVNIFTGVLWSAFKNSEQANIECMIDEFIEMLKNGTAIIYSADNEIID